MVSLQTYQDPRWVIRSLIFRENPGNKKYKIKGRTWTKSHLQRTSVSVAKIVSPVLWRVLRLDHRCVVVIPVVLLSHQDGVLSVPSLVPPILDDNERSDYGHNQQHRPNYHRNDDLCCKMKYETYQFQTCFGNGQHLQRCFQFLSPADLFFHRKHPKSNLALKRRNLDFSNLFFCKCFSCQALLTMKLVLSKVCAVPSCTKQPKAHLLQDWSHMCRLHKSDCTENASKTTTLAPSLLFFTMFLVNVRNDIFGPQCFSCLLCWGTKQRGFGWAMGGPFSSSVHANDNDDDDMATQISR